MGYRRPTLKLQFADPEMEGLEVRARRLSVEGLIKLAGLANLSALPTEEGLTELNMTIASALISWNVEEEVTQEDGTTTVVPVPCDAMGLASQDFGFVLAIGLALMGASASVAPPLPAPSSNGAASPEASIPMEVIPLPSPPS